MGYFPLFIAVFLFGLSLNPGIYKYPINFPMPRKKGIPPVRKAVPHFPFAMKNNINANPTASNVTADEKLFGSRAERGCGENLLVCCVLLGLPSLPFSDSKEDCTPSFTVEPDGL